MSRFPRLSSRATKLQVLPKPHVYAPPAGPYYEPDLYPDGVINLSTAENSLLSDRLIENFSRPLTIYSPHLKYRNTLIKMTLPTVEDLLPQYVNDNFQPLVPVTRENSVAGPGIGALLAQLIWAIADEGAGVLLSAPFYDDYVRDIVHPTGALPVLAEIPAEIDSLSMEVIPYLEKTLLESAARGVQIQVLLLCNPHNPLPQIVAKEVVQGYALLAEKHNLHLVVDEVYGMSTFESAYPPTPNVPFESILSYDLAAMGVDPSRVHVLAGPTKDFGASGFKVGLLVSSSNLPLLELVRPLFRATPISAASDPLFARVLNDKPFVEKFLVDNRKMLGAAYELVARWLIFHGLSFTRANAGVYVLVDLAPFIERIGSSSSGGTEKLDLAVAVMLAEKVFLKPTTLMADPIPTRFRLIFTHPRPTMELALRRIERAFGGLIGAIRLHQLKLGQGR
ncbi:PLP-dependent transferase [Mycena sanguinolenta]|uniref:PLP-dependent transferase n=1 Tax=Mycena sanguinolenta TaxID=230812 RepID=A0A8H6ZAF4_9AGAR|nr:PLP-dependent transferase [Mycena sanguinolenta]